MNSDKLLIVLTIVLFMTTVLFIINQMYLYPIGVASTTGSMTPQVTGYDIIIGDKTVEYHELNQGDIIMFERNCNDDVNPFDDELMNGIYDNMPEKNENIMHRIVGNSSSGYVTKGDNNTYIDQTRVCVDYVDKKSYNGKITNIFSVSEQEFMLLRNTIFSIFGSSILFLLLFIPYNIVKDMG